MTTLRLTFRVGVSSPPSWVKSSGSTRNFLIFAYDWSLEFFSSTVRSTRSTTFGCFTSTAGSLAMIPCSWANFLSSSRLSVMSATGYGRRSPYNIAWLRNGSAFKRFSMFCGAIECQHRARLGQSVAFENQDTGGVEEFGDVPRQRRAARHRPLEPAAERGVELREDERVGEPVLDGDAARDRLPLLLQVADLRSDVHGPVKDPLLDGRARFHAGQDLRVDLLVDAWDAADEVL